MGRMAQWTEGRCFRTSLNLACLLPILYCRAKSSCEFLAWWTATLTLRIDLLGLISS